MSTGDAARLALLLEAVAVDTVIGPPTGTFVDVDVAMVAAL